MLNGFKVDSATPFNSSEATPTTYSFYLPIMSAFIDKAENPTFKPYIPQLFESMQTSANAKLINTPQAPQGQKAISTLMSVMSVRSGVPLPKPLVR